MTDTPKARNHTKSPEPKSKPKPEKRIAALHSKFSIGDLVTKRSGSSWTGRVCGHYSSTLTDDGICVESFYEPGAVQLYPSAAFDYLYAAEFGKVLEPEDKS